MVEIDVDKVEGKPINKGLLIGGIIIVGIIAFFIYAISSGHPVAKIVNGTTISNNVECKFIKGDPDNTCTPGVTLPVPAIGVCSPSYPIIGTDENTKLDIYRKYGITNIEGWDIQYWIPLELGGNNNPNNLFPMAAEPKPGYNERNAAIKRLKEMVCTNQIPLVSAQYMITHDWRNTPELYS